MKKLVEIEDMRYAIPYGKEIYHGVNLHINEGEIVGLLGVNGSGKTTLIDLILGLRNNYTGKIQVLDETPSEINRQRLEDIFFISQDLTLPGKFTIEEFCEFNKILYSNYNVNIEKQLMKFFELQYDTKIGSLSTGQQRKVQIVCALSAQPKLLIVDEITAVLDPETRSKFYLALKKSQEQFGVSVVIATNIAEDLVECAQRIYFIKEKQVLEHSSHEINQLFNLK